MSASKHVRKVRSSFAGRLPVIVTGDLNSGPAGTFNAFKEVGDNRIDYVFVSPGIDVLKHGILTDRWDLRFPSDHLPVIASLGLRCR